MALLFKCVESELLDELSVAEDARYLVQACIRIRWGGCGKLVLNRVQWDADVPQELHQLTFSLFIFTALLVRDLYQQDL